MASNDSKATNELIKSFQKIGVMGVACRLPGAQSYDALKTLLLNGKCAVTEIPDNRFTKARYLHPKQGTRGKTYTFAAGVLDDIWAFDPIPFGISPREATQMDPQQRLLLQVVWEAIEDASIPHTKLAGKRIGVYVGASSTDHRDYNTFDPGSTDPYMMTGNTMSLIANRISYIFDFNGPSFAVDTACSSSLVAMENAISALKKGEIDTAIVGGVNALLSPFPFIGFSAAGMLSPEGLCRAFDANGAGYVRAEGAIAVVLQRTDLAAQAICMPRMRAQIIAAGANSDGKTVGVSLPSHKTQGALLRQLYDDADVDPNDLAFFEAHGTGTRVGDPAEAQAIGENIAQRRDKPLMIGSIKSNIGHLEPAAGLAGLLKAIIAFEEGALPPSLHLEELNPDIPFKALNLSVASKKTPLGKSDKLQYAGISTFGFGGTNAHVIIRDVPRDDISLSAQPQVPSESGLLTLSAHGEAALKAMASRYADMIDTHPDLSIGALDAAIKQQRSHLPNCLSVRAKNPNALSHALRSFSTSDEGTLFTENATLTTGKSDRTKRSVAFVFNGNGAQFVGMGRDEYNNNNVFKSHFDAISTQAEPTFGWSAADMLLDPDLAAKLDSTAIAQPLLFTLHVTIAACLKDLGIMPDISFGHSVGEIAAATVSGALSIDQGIRVIHARSQQQETTRGKGKMAVGGLSSRDAEPILSDIRSSGKIITCAAINAPNSITVSGEIDAVERFVLTVKSLKLPAKVLDLDYGFHCPLMDPIESGIRKQLSDLAPTRTNHAFISTVTGKAIDGTALNADYWWRNIRQPVLFKESAEEAFEMGCRVFIEIGPRALFRSYLRDIFNDRSETITTIETLKQTIQTSALQKHSSLELGKHCELAALKAIASGANYQSVTKSDDNKNHITLPSYPWQNKSFRMEATAETYNNWQATDHYHMLLGHTEHADANYWRSQIDVHVLPMLADHCVDGKVIVPGAAYAEMALAAASHYFHTERVEIRDMSISRAIEIPEDQMIETHTEISSDTSSISISSRRRLSEDEWTLNATARIAKIPSETPEETAPLEQNSNSVLLHKEALYKLANDYGLSYGPAFARAEVVALADDDTIHVTISPADETLETRAGAAPFMLHPTDLDIAFHGLIALYESNDQQEIKRGFIPIRFGNLQIFKPGIRARFARISVNRFSPRNISADFNLYDTDGHLIAKLEDARFRAASLVQKQKLNDYTYRFGSRLTPHPMALQSTLKTNKPLSLPNNCFLKGEWGESEARLLLEAAAQRIAFDTVQSLTTDHTLNTQNLIERGKVQVEDLPRLISFLTICENAGFATNKPSQDDWVLSAEIDLPDSDTILRTTLTTYPTWSAECVMLSHIAHHAARRGVQSIEKPSAFESSTLDQHRTASPEAKQHIDTTVDLITTALSKWPDKKPFRILEIGNAGGGLVRKLQPLLNNGQGTLVSCGSDGRTRGILRLAMMNYPNIEILDTNELVSYVKTAPAFDFIVSANGLHAEQEAEPLLRLAAKSIAQNGRLIISETQPTTFHDVLFAYEDKWFARAVNPAFPLSAQRMGEEWLHLLEGAGFKDFTVHEADDESLPALFIQASKTAVADTATNVVSLHNTINHDREDDTTTRNNVPVFIFASPQEKEMAEALCDLITIETRVLVIDVLSTKFADTSITDGFPAVFDVIDMTTTETDADQALLSSRIKRINSLVHHFGDRMHTLWITAPGGARTLAGFGSSNPIQTAIWAYARTVRNEYPDLTLRTVDFAENLSKEQETSLLAAHVANNTTWTEAILAEDACIELIAEIGLPPTTHDTAKTTNPALLSTLAFEDLAGVDELNWTLRERRNPQAGEVEVEVTATGLNFRDVMWTLGVLPDEALEDGFAGPTLGFECSGRICALGEGVTRFKIGDPVIALGPACFSSHLTVNEISVVPLPEDMDLVSAATIPVTFLTAYYALHDLARLEADEWILIQGGAGGVGLAAIQIAQECGARIIATAGTDEKRDLLRTLGADHVLDSRSLDFIDQVKQITGTGVDCVLNSLFGEAMERGIELLKPFGRFLELGKRDYYGNTKIGLRPFRRNITYFGIDADQLLSQKPKLAQRLFTDLMARFEDGTFSPLPYRKFSGHDIIDAFRLMQKSGHIGKIVVTPTPPEELTQSLPSKPFTFSSDGHIIVIGGLGGFGIEIAKWLGDKKARTITLTSRSGAVTPEQQDIFDGLKARDIHINAVACDVSDEQALNTLLTTLRKTAPIKGIIHAAMVLRDGLINNMSEQDVDDVLSPKVKGAYNIDKLTSDDPLEAFILFSSITTFIGNPGQANYVAANGYLEGLSRKRRQNGKPALAVGWGAITDVGYLARHRDVGEAISKRSGTMKFTATQALNALDVLLSRNDGSLEWAALSVAPMNWGIAKGGLSILKTPPYVVLSRRADQASQGTSETLNIEALIEGKTEPEARALISAILAKEVSVVLRTPVEEINLKRPLSDLGMDSLMGVELRMTAQQKMGIDIPLASIANGVSVDDIAKKIVTRINTHENNSKSQQFTELASYHLETGNYAKEIESFKTEINVKGD